MPDQPNANDAAALEVESWLAPRRYPSLVTPVPAPSQQRIPVSFTPTNADEMWRYAEMLARSSLLPRAYYNWEDDGGGGGEGRRKQKRGAAKVADVHFTLMRGQQLSVPPMVAIGNINIVEGKAEIGAQLMVALCLRSGMCEYFEPRESTSTKAVFATKRVGATRELVFEYDLEEARQMGLLDKGRTEWEKANNNWRKQPRTMLRRRCQSMLAREIYPDIVMGLYDHEELTELRDREIALGVDPDRVIPMNGLGHGTLAGDLPEGRPGPIAAAAPRRPDPLKAAIVLRRQAERAADARCRCGAPLDELDTNGLCMSCSRDEAERRRVGSTRDDPADDDGWSGFPGGRTDVDRTE